MGSRSPVYSYEVGAGDSLGTTDEDLQDEAVKPSAQGEKNKCGKEKDEYGELPDTQPIEEGEVVRKRSKQPQQPAWGILMSEDNEYFDNVSLVGNEIICGKQSEHQCKLDKDKIEEDCFNQFSRTHFKIERIFESDQSDKEPADVYITDLSLNGTFINQERLEKEKKRALLHKDIIAMTSEDRVAFKVVLINQETNDDLNTSQLSSTHSNSNTPNIHTLPEELKKKYVVGRKLGNGACGSAYLAYSKHQFDKNNYPKKYCVKVIGNNNKSLPPATASSQFLQQTIRVTSKEGTKYSSSSRGTLGSSGPKTGASADTSYDSFRTPKRPSTLKPHELTNEVNFSKIHKSEIDILKHLNDRNKSHPNIIGFVEAFECSTSIAIVFELARGGELFDYIVEDFQRNAFEEGNAKIQFYQILSGIKYLHDNNVCHRDLKLENILCCEKNKRGLIKITDFGLSKLLLNHCPMTTYVGTPCYIAPEVLYNNSEADSKKHKPYTMKADMWSLGCILYSLLCGSSAFHPDGNDDKILKEQIMKADYMIDPEMHPIWLNVSWEAKDLIAKLLVVDPEKRLSATQALNHRWFTSDLKILEEVERIMERGRRNQIERGPSDVTALADSMDIVSVEADKNDKEDAEVTPPTKSPANSPQTPAAHDTPDNRGQLAAADQRNKTETEKFMPASKRKAVEAEVDSKVPAKRGPKRTLMNWDMDCN